MSHREPTVDERVAHWLRATSSDSTEMIIQLLYRVFRLEDEVRALRAKVDAVVQTMDALVERSRAGR